MHLGMYDRRSGTGTESLERLGWVLYFVRREPLVSIVPGTVQVISTPLHNLGLTVRPVAAVIMSFFSK